MQTALFPEVVVNGQAVPHAEVAAEVQNHSAPSGKPGIAWRKAADAVAVRTLMLQEARRRGLRPEPAALGGGRREADEEALIRGLLEAAVNPEPPVEEDIRAEWARDPGRFRAPPLWEVSHILCACDAGDEAADAAAAARARDLTARALAGPAAFAALAGRESDCPSRASGGALGQLRPGDTVPEFEAALRRLADGEITAEPVRTQHGWHVIRMDAVAPGAVLPYETVRPKIAEAIEKARWVEAARAFVADLVAAAEVSGAELGRARRG